MSDSVDLSAFRGYIASRPVDGSRAPQHIQNLVVREHARKYGLTYLLSATEYAMPGCYMMLEQALDELPHIGGVIAYSMFMLPRTVERRRRVYDRVLAAGRQLHAAVEDMIIASPADVARWEDVFLVRGAFDRPPVAEAGAWR
jgi:sporadic carbohydrate cluster protein (TIGR04323 family)